MTDNSPASYHRHTPEERSRLIEILIREKFETRKTWEEIAAKHNLHRTTITRWRQTEEWLLAEAKWRRMRREELRTDVHDIGHNAIQVLQDLMNNVDGNIGSFTRVTAAKTLLEMIGLDQELEERKVDKVDEVVDFFKKLGREPNLPQPRVQPLLNIEVLPGGMLPEMIVEQNKLMYDRLHNDDEDVIDGEFTYTDDDPDDEDPSAVSEDERDIDDVRE